VDEPVEVLLGGERRVAVAVDPNHLGRDALADLGLVERLGEEHEPRVGVEVDEPRGDDHAGRVDRAPGWFRDIAVRTQDAQPTLANLDRARAPRRPRPVDDRATDDPNLRPTHR
jgi:hypothetical protein